MSPAPIVLKSLLAFLLLTSVFRSAVAQVMFPLRVSDDRRYLVDQRGKPFPIMGRTAWFIISQPEEGYKKFIENTLLHGHNAIEFAAITHWPMGNNAPFNGEGAIPFVKSLNGMPWDGRLKYDSIQVQAPDLTTPNEK